MGDFLTEDGPVPGYDEDGNGEAPAAIVLHPAENMALTVARGQVSRGESVPPNTATMLVLALDRLTGRSDWTADDTDALAESLTGRSGGSDGAS